jgi:hypothetical protein
LEFEAVEEEALTGGADADAGASVAVDGASSDDFACNFDVSEFFILLVGLEEVVFTPLFNFFFADDDSRVNAFFFEYFEGNNSARSFAYSTSSNVDEILYFFEESFFKNNPTT